MYTWKLRKYVCGPEIIYGGHTHRSVRNAQSTRGCARADAKGQRGKITKMGINWFFAHLINGLQILCAYPESLQVFRRTCKILMKTSSSQRLFGGSSTTWKKFTLENPLNEWWKWSNTSEIMNSKEHQLFSDHSGDLYFDFGRNTSTSTPMLIRDPVPDSRFCPVPVRVLWIREIPLKCDQMCGR